MPIDSLAELISALTPEEQAAVREFIEFLKHRETPAESPFLTAIDEFVDQHPEFIAPPRPVTFYPSVEEVVAAHRRLLARFGGSPGLRDREALESALARPQAGYYSDLKQLPCGRLSSRQRLPAAI